MSRDLQAELNRTRTAGATLDLSPQDEVMGPLVITRPVTIDGHGASILASPGPAITIENGPVVLRQLILESPGACALRVKPGAAVQMHDVQIIGNIEGIPGEEGVWVYDRDVNFGTMVMVPGVAPRESIRVTVPVACTVDCQIDGVTAEPSSLQAGTHEIWFQVAQVEDGTFIAGSVFLATPQVRRKLNVTGRVSVYSASSSFSVPGIPLPNSSVPIHNVSALPPATSAPMPFPVASSVPASASARPVSASTPSKPKSSPQSAPQSTPTASPSAHPSSVAPRPVTRHVPRVALRSALLYILLTALLGGAAIAVVRGLTGGSVPQFKQITALVKAATIEPVLSVAMSPDGTLAARGSNDRSVKLFDVATGEAKWRVAKHDGEVLALAFSTDGKTLASAGDDGKIWLWDAVTGEFQQSINSGGKLTAMAFSQGVLAVAKEGGALELRDPKTGDLQRTLAKHDDTVRVLAFSPDGTVLVSGGDDNKIVYWALSTSEDDVFRGFSPPVTALVVSTDARVIAAGVKDGTVHVWEKNNPQPQLNLAGHFSAVRGLHFYAGGRVLVGLASDGKAVFWNMDSGNQTQTLEGEFVGHSLFALSSDGRTFVTGALDGSLLLWRFE